MHIGNTEGEGPTAKDRDPCLRGSSPLHIKGISFVKYQVQCGESINTRPMHRKTNGISASNMETIELRQFCQLWYYLPSVGALLNLTATGTPCRIGILFLIVDWVIRQRLPPQPPRVFGSQQHYMAADLGNYIINFNQLRPTKIN